MSLMVIAWVGDQFGLLSFLDGASTSDSQLDILDRQISKADKIIQQGVTAQKRLETYAATSLPYDPIEARSRYHEWITQLVEQANIQQSSLDVATPTTVSVKAGNGKTQEVYKKYEFTLTGFGRIEQVTQFLFAFYRGPHLHKINTVSMSPTSGGSFNVNIQGEALGVGSCERESTLATGIANRLAHSDRAAYDQIVRRNIFSPDAAKTLKQIVLSSVTFDKLGLPEAWLQIGPQPSTRRLQRGEILNLQAHAMELIDVQPKSILVAWDGQLLDIELGQSVHQALEKSAEPVSTLAGKNHEK